MASTRVLGNILALVVVTSVLLVQGARDKLILAEDERRAPHQCDSASIQDDWLSRGLKMSRKSESGRAYVACPGGKEQKVSCFPDECVDAPWCFVDNHCGSWLFGCHQTAGFDLRCPVLAPLSAWALLGLTNYSVAPGHDGDWFSHGDVYASVVLGLVGSSGMSRVYNSDVRWNSNTGSHDFHLYVPRAGTVHGHEFRTDVSVFFHDKDVLSTDDIIGEIKTIELSNGTFEYTLTNSQGDATGTVQGYVATGEDLERQAASLSMRGRVPLIGAKEQGDEFVLATIRNDEVEQELEYARTGSAIPETLHGIFWMDQRGKHLPIPSDPDYKQVCASAADELLVTFGEGNWDPEELCFRDVSLPGGSPTKGHWTWMNEGWNTRKTWTDGWNRAWEGSKNENTRIEFCFSDSSLQTIELVAYIKAGDWLENFAGYNLPETIDGFIKLPRSVMSWNMRKKPWGWDRESVVGPDARKLRNVLKGDLFQWLDNVNIICHYPVFQVVDGNGERTEHYDAYLAWANTDFPECKESTFECPLANGNGTSLVGRLGVKHH